ncbi:MAG: asparagine synthase (glutamine-hydrolyzing) [Phycisphaerales bacterium]
MCGLAGFVDFASRVDDPASALVAMARRLVHRGPDDEGISFDAATRTGLAFRRLSVLDLSPAGHQPMRSASGRFEIAFNGEVYNHDDIRDDIRGEIRPGASAGAANFRGHSDTETMLAAFEAFGVEAAIERFRGMFAFAVLDRRNRVLWLVRDRFGVKPMHYGWTGGAEVAASIRRAPGVAHTSGADSTAAAPLHLAVPPGAALAFASEIKALRALPTMRLSVDRGALTLFMRHGYVPGPLSIHPEVRKLRPGHLLRVDLDARTAEERCWWHSRDLVRAGRAAPFAGSDGDAVDAVAAALDESVRLRMLADVPLGAFLSGGIDSTAVVASMQAQSPRPVRTFTIGFGAQEFDEAPYARAVARHLGTEHTEVYVTGEEALATVPQLADTWDEPFADSSQIPTLLVSRIARRSVTVALSGDGGDELFGGYYRYAWTSAIAARTRLLPPPARAAVAMLLRATPRRALNAVGTALARALPARVAIDRAGDRAHKLAGILRHGDPWTIYLGLVATIADAPMLVLGGSEPVTALTDPAQRADELDLETRMMQADIASYLVDDILVKVDRASMATSLEAREPLLDHRLAELAFRLPLAMKIRGGERKWVLRRAVERRVPRALLDRPKMGFGVPLAQWLRGPLRGWAEALLAEDRIRAAGHLDPDRVRAIWRRTVDPASSSSGYEAWNLLMFESWRERWGH